MIRTLLARRAPEKKAEFRWRGTEISRLENFSDAAFGFALTLLVVSQQVPQTFQDLIRTLEAFPGFAIGFLFLVHIWYRHYIFFRRYGLEDRVIVGLNAALLFVILFSVYPLKFISSLWTTALTTHDVQVVLASGKSVPMVHLSQMPLIFALYGGGISAISLLFALLYTYAYTQRHTLTLNALEVHETISSVQFSLLGVLLGLFPYSVALLILHRRSQEGLLAMFGVILAVQIYTYQIRRRRSHIVRRMTEETKSMILGLHHAQITVPPDGIDTAREFYCTFLGLPEIPKPDSLSGRGGFWLRVGPQEVHVSPEEGVRRDATKAHLAYQVDDLTALRECLAERGLAAGERVPIPGYDRLEIRDPFGNRVEFIQKTGIMKAHEAP